MGWRGVVGGRENCVREEKCGREEELWKIESLVGHRESCRRKGEMCEIGRDVRGRPICGM